MPSPFPGMDPYLENPLRWPSFHLLFISEISRHLNRALPPHYAAVVEKRVYIEDTRRHYRPDVVVRDHPRENSTAQGAATISASTALADEPWLVASSLDPEEEWFIEVQTVDGEHRVVTAIELLSPTNKNGSEGRRQYLEKQGRMLEAQTHFLEIDLLRGGPHTVAPSQDILSRYGFWDYLVSLHRAGSEGFEVWAVTLRQRLPRVRVPLDPGEPDVVLDLQAVFTNIYDDGVFHRILNYTRDPVPPLSHPDDAWADALLREKGLRT